MTRTPSRVAAVTALALGLAACGGDDEPTTAEPATPEATAEAPDEGPPPVAMVDNNFGPSMLTVAGGQEVTIDLRNNGQNSHTFTIDELGVDTGIVEPGEEASATFAVPESGEIEFYCTVHGREVMSGTITVE